ncbi:MAG TPA: family 20 glycosylhydrolase [Stenotrophomonas sp.]|nr:family 20 glycosylhydrolase [Stenotrophomonas sp.]
MTARNIRLPRWALLLAALTPAAFAANPLPVIPAPAQVRDNGQGAFALTPQVTVRAADSAAATTAQQFIAGLERGSGLRLALAPAGSRPGKGEIVFAIDPKASPSPEGYVLDIGRDGVRARAADPRGLFYAAVTLWQLAPARGQSGPATLPATHIADAPRFGWRGLMLDSARHFQSIEQIKSLLDAMALHKFNTFHWHLTDDQGWRMEIKRYPKLTEVGGCRIPAGDGGIGADGRPAPYCGFYTQAQMREVVRYAAERHITVVPEIDIPGHATAAIAAYPELGVSGQPVAVSNEWGVNTNLFNADEATLQFFENVLAEVLQIFPARYVHLGGDEAVKDQWKASPRMQARIRELGLENEEALQGWMLKRLERYLVAHDRLMIGWDEIIAGGLPPEAAVMSWRGIDGGLEAARLGHDVVMAPSSELYLDYQQTDSPDEPPGRPSLIELQRVYAFEPVPAALEESQRGHILGLQANTWTEHMRSFARVEHAMFPRAAAVAETGWSPQANRDYADFRARLPHLLALYRAWDVAYAQTPFQPKVEVAPGSRDGHVRITLSDRLGYDEVRYTTDGSAPSATSPRYTAPFELALPAQLQAVSFWNGQALAAPVVRTLSAQSLRSRSDEELAMCTGKLMLRLEDDGPREGERAIFNADIFNPCWEWKQADLRGVASLKIRAGRLPYYFQLAHDEPLRTFQPAHSAYGELVVRNGCEGPTLANIKLPAQPDADGFYELTARLPKTTPAQANLCLYFTGDTRPTMWVLDRVTLDDGR